VKRVLAVVVAVAAGVLFGNGTASAASREARVPMSDGVALGVTLSTPDAPPPTAGWPVIMIFHGLGGSRSAPYGRTTLQQVAEDVFVRAGYATLTFDARGHGTSGGACSLAGEREVQDVRELLAWLDHQPGVDGSTVGGLGISLGAGAVLRATAERVPFKAIVPITGWTDLLRALAPQGLSKSGLVVHFLSLVPPNRWAPAVQAVTQDAVRSTNRPLLAQFAAERSVAGRLREITTPTFVMQGRRDFAFDLAEARTAFRRLGGPKRVYIGDLGHPPATNPVAEQPHYFGEARDWFDRWLKGARNGIDTRPPVEIAPDQWTGRTYEYKRFPATSTLSLRLHGRKTVAARGRAVWTVKLPRKRLETFGAPRVRLAFSTPTSWPNLVAVLSAVSPGGAQTVVSEGGMRLTERNGIASFRLIDDAALLRPRTRLKLTVAASTTAENPANLLYLDLGMPADARLTIRRGTVRLPVLNKPISR
jgi:predicted acyl esterase